MGLKPLLFFCSALPLRVNSCHKPPLAVFPQPPIKCHWIPLWCHLGGHCHPRPLPPQSFSLSARQPSDSMKINYDPVVDRVDRLIRCAAWRGGGASFPLPVRYSILSHLRATLWKVHPHIMPLMTADGEKRQDMCLPKNMPVDKK